MNKQQEARQQLSKEIEWWSRGKSYILMTLATGVGKSFNALNLISKSKLKGKGLILVPETTLQKNFKDDAYKHGFNSLVDNSDIICYASLGKYCENDYEWIIMDECHRATSDLRVEHLQKLKPKKVIALSATVSEEIELILQSVFPFEKFELSASEAMDLGILPKPEIKVIEMELDCEIDRNEFSYGKKKVKCTDREYYKKLSDSITYWKDRYEDGEVFAGNKMKQQGSERLRFLGKCKTQKVKELLREIGDERAIVFCASVDQANDLGGKLVVSSKKTKKTNEGIIDDFNNHKTDKIFACSKLVEGTNLSECKYGILIQLNNQEREFLQKLGRNLRHHSPIIYILKMINTVDDRFFGKSTANLNEEYITYD